MIPVAFRIKRRFNNIGYKFTSMCKGGLYLYDNIYDKDHNYRTQIDILLENDEYVIAVEVKAEVRENDIEHHINRLEILREWRNERNYPSIKIRGAIAGAIFPDEFKLKVLEAGMYVLEQSGDTMLLEVPETDKLRDF